MSSNDKYFHHQTPRFRTVKSKLFSDREKLAKRLEVVRTEPRDIKIVFTNGCFDMAHPGHVAYLREARALGTHLVVALNSDGSISRNKGANRPILRLKERAKVVASFEFVDFVVAFSEDDPRELLRVLKPDLLVKGGDYTVEEVVGREEMQEWGGQVAVVSLLPGYSSSNVLRRMKEASEARQAAKAKA